MDILKFIENIDLTRFQCAYCDFRIEDVNKTTIRFRNHEFYGCAVQPSLGAFIRVYNRGQWFYCSTTEIIKIESIIDKLIKQSEKFNGKSIDFYSDIVPYNKQIIKYSQIAVNNVSVEEKKELCESYFDVLKAYPSINDNQVIYSDEYLIKYFKSSKNVTYAYDNNMCSMSFSFILRDGDKLYSDRYSEYSSEFSLLKKLHENLKHEITESEKFLHAPTVIPGKYQVVLGSKVVGVFAHESFGHKSEADFLLGDENAKEEWKIGKKIGTEKLTIVDEGLTEDVSGYCPFDDEGTPAKKNYLIKNGKLEGRLHSGITARTLNESKTGNARSINFEYEPIVRMTNTYIEPGKISFAEMLKQVEQGIYVKECNHGSGLSTFTIAPSKAYYIRQGKIAEPVRISVITGTVFQTLHDIEECADDFQLHSSVLGGCGKMEQSPLHVGLGGPSILVRSMNLS